MTNKKQAMEYEIHGLKCDAKNCDYFDHEAKVEDYPQYLDKPCPKCGANLLTEADLKATQMMMAACDWINALNLPTQDSPSIRVRMNMDGSGIPMPEIITDEAKGNHEQ